MTSAAPSGLIHAKRLDGRGGANDIAWTEVDKEEEEGNGVWLHFDFEEPEAQQWLEHHSQLNDVAFAALTNHETRPRALNRGDKLLLSLRGINLTQGADPEDMVSLRFWTDGKRLISTRRRPHASTQDVLEELQAGNGPRNTPELLVGWIDRITEHMNDTVERLTDALLEVEDRVLSEHPEGTRLDVVKLRKQSISIKRYLSPQRDAMNRLYSENITWIDEINRLRLREINDRLIRYIEDLDEVRDRAALVQEELSNRIAEQLNERSYFFTVVAVIFLPLGFLTGLLGINVGGMPGTDSAQAFWIVVLLCAVLAALLALLLKLRRWM